MNKTILIGLAASAAAIPSVAFAQDASDAPVSNVPVADVFVVASVGYHDLAISDDAPDGFDVDDASVIYGAAAGFDIPIGTNLFVGLEGNFHFGNDVIDHEFGGNARLGVRTEAGNKFYLRGGYQKVDLDPSKLLKGVNIPAGALSDIDDTAEDFLVGVGADMPMGGMMIRGTVDTVSFDSLRATVGVGFAF